jgi:hypothetical protein
VTTWHATPDELTAYRHGGGGDNVQVASVEAHLLACPACRRALGANDTARADTDRRWAALSARMDAAPSTSRRGLHWYGITRPALSTRPLLVAGLAAVVLLLTLPLLSIMVVGAGSTIVLVAVAPLAPMAAVVLAYRQATDPAGELALATPMAGFRLVATRAVAVALVATPVAVVAALVLQLPTYAVFGWVLPGLALAALVLAAGTLRADPAVAAGVLGGAWALAVVVPTLSRRATDDLVAQAVASPSTQLLAAAVAVGALALAVSRRDHVTYRRTR